MLTFRERIHTQRMTTNTCRRHTHTVQNTHFDTPITDMEYFHSFVLSRTHTHCHPGPPPTPRPVVVVQCVSPVELPHTHLSASARRTQGAPVRSKCPRARRRCQRHLKKGQPAHSGCCWCRQTERMNWVDCQHSQK